MVKKKEKRTFDQFINDNRKQILKDEIMLNMIEERMEKRWMERNLS